MNYHFVFNIDESDHKKNGKQNSQKLKSPSTAVGVVLDFMQALKETPILHRSSQINCYQPIPNEEEDPIQADIVDKVVSILLACFMICYMFRFLLVFQGIMFWSSYLLVINYYISLTEAIVLLYLLFRSILCFQIDVSI